MEMIFWWAIIAIIILSPLAFVGIFIIFRKFIEFILIRRGRVKMLFFTSNRGIKTTIGKPQSNVIPVGGKKSFIFNPKHIFRWGNTPTVVYNEESVDPLNPLETSTQLSPRRLDDIEFNWFNAGVRTTQKVERIMTILLIGVIIANVVLAGVIFVSWQTLNNIGVSLGEIPERVIEKLPEPQVVAAPTEEMPVIS